VFVCYYGELDPYVGTVPQVRPALPRVVRDLSFLCLFYDLVIVPPGTLFSHGLLLPAFLHLAPFVRAGRLGTTADPGGGSPRDYVVQRAERELSKLGSQRRPSTVASWRRREIGEVVARYRDLLPDDWPLTRSVGWQVEHFDERIIKYAEEHADRDRLAPRLLEVIDRGRQKGRDAPDRNVMYAYLGRLRGTVPPEESARYARFAQAAYFHMGAAVHETHGEGAVHSELFPTAFLRGTGGMGPLPELPWELPVAWHMRPDLVAERMRRAGLRLDRILSLPVSALFKLALWREWRSLRPLFAEDGIPEEVYREVRSVVVRSRDFREALAKAEPLGRAAAASLEVAPTLLPEAWQSAAQGLLGSALATSSRDHDEFVLDFPSGELRRTADQAVVLLTPAQTRLVAVLALAGEIGHHVGDILELLSDLDLLARYDTPLRPKVAPRELRNNADVLKTALNRDLQPLGLAIEVHHGRWSLAGGRVALRGTPWHASDETAPPAAPPIPLPPQLAVIWAALARHCPEAVSGREIARALGKEMSDHEVALAARAVYRLRRALQTGRAAWEVVGLHRGSYRLARTARSRGRTLDGEVV